MINKEKSEIKNELLFLIIKIIVFVLILVVSFTVIFGITRNSDNSMAPAFKNGDVIFYFRLQKDYRAKDTVIIQHDGKNQIRRVIAKEGDTVNITENGLEINGYIQQEQDIYKETLPYKYGVTFPIVLGKDEYFVLGDNRSSTEDSRIYGTVSKKEIKGIVITMLRRRNF